MRWRRVTTCFASKSHNSRHPRVGSPQGHYFKGTNLYSIIFHHKLFHHISFPKLFHHIPSISPLPLTPWPLLHATGRRLRATKPSHVAPEPLPWPEQGKVLLEQPEGLNNLAGDVGMSDFEHQMY